MVWAQVGQALLGLAPTIGKLVQPLSVGKTVQTTLDVGTSIQALSKAFKVAKKERRRKYKIVRGRKMRWDSRYQGYVAVRRGRRLNKERKLRLMSMLIASGVSTPQAGIMVGL